MKYLVTISQTLEIEADDKDDANRYAALLADYQTQYHDGSIDFETEELPDDSK